MKLYTEILGSRQARVLRRLGPVLTPLGFYLAGGTALALQLGHRRSVDLDWFTARPLGDPLLLVRWLRDGDIALNQVQVAPGTLHGVVSGVRVSMLEYPYALLRRLVKCPQFGCGLGSPADIATMKLSAIVQRGAKKDFVDVYALAKTTLTLQKMLAQFQQRFGVDDLAHVLCSLVYFDDADRERMPRMRWQANWREIKASIRKMVQDLG